MKDQFRSTFGVLVALAGSAVGLGNLWRFPYLVGTNGGAAFIIIYLLFVLVLCLPIMYSEILIGRRQSEGIKSIKLLSVISAFVVFSFYAVVGGWSLGYLIKAFSFSVVSTSSEVLEQVYNSSITAVWQPLINTFLFILATGAIIMFGISKGIERFSKVLMPILFIMVIIIAVRSLMLEGAGAGVRFLFQPDFSKVTGKTVLDALGQAFFSLSIGCGSLLTYGFYIQKRENIVKAASFSALSDVVFAIIAGLAIMPAVFAFGISPTEGPGLVFITLPHIFAQIAGGEIFAICFFITFFIAAITSSISILEVLVSYVIERFKISRLSAVIISSLSVSTIAIFASLSFGLLGDVKIFDKSIFTFLENLSANILIPIVGFMTVAYVGWRMKREEFEDEITSGGTIKFKRWILNAIYLIIKYIAPIVVAIILVAGLL